MAVCGDTNIPPIKNAIMIFLHLNSNLVIKYAVIVDTNNIAITEMPVTKILSDNKLPLLLSRQQHNYSILNFRVKKMYFCKIRYLFLMNLFLSKRADRELLPKKDLIQYIL